MRTPARAKFHLGFSVLVIGSLAALALSGWLFKASITAAVEKNGPGEQASQMRGKSYLKMTEEEQKQFIADKAESISFALGNSGGMSVKDKISPEAVAALKPLVDNYAKRQTSAKSGCDFGREPLSGVLGRWWRNDAAITRAFEAERDMENPVPDQQWEWLYPRIGPYLAMVESEFCPCLPGANGKLGFFQLTPELAAQYGLKVRADKSAQGVDERCHISKAAMAAAKHLKSLAEGKETPLRTLIAFARYHRGRDIPLPLDDPFWAFVVRTEFRASATAVAETQAFAFIRKLFAAAIVLEHPEFFDTSLPPEAAGEARVEKIRQQMDADFLKIMTSTVILQFVSHPQTKFDEWLKTESANTELWQEILMLNPVLPSRDTTASLALKNAPVWLRNLASNLSRVRGLSGRITRHPYHDQTVYYLQSDLISVLYDKNGEIICTIDFPAEKGDAAEKCPGFKPHRRNGQPLWQSRNQRHPK